MMSPVTKPSAPMSVRSVSTRAVRPAKQQTSNKARSVLVALSAAWMLSTATPPAEALVPKFNKGEQREQGYQQQNDRLQALFAKEQAKAASSITVAQVCPRFLQLNDE